MNNLLTPLDRLTTILVGITCRLVGLIGRDPAGSAPRTPAERLCLWLQNLIHRLDRLPTAKPRRQPAPHPRPAAPPPRTAIRAPQSAGWLLYLSEEIAGHADQLYQLLRHSGLPAACAESPAIARSLRRLLILLEIPCPEALQTPAAKAAAAGATPHRHTIPRPHRTTSADPGPPAWPNTACLSTPWPTPPPHANAPS